MPSAPVLTPAGCAPTQVEVPGVIRDPATVPGSKPALDCAYAGERSDNAAMPNASAVRRRVAAFLIRTPPPVGNARAHHPRG